MQVYSGSSSAITIPPCALTIGNFDGVHLGHQAMLAHLREAAHRRGLPTALLTFEPLPRELFTPLDPPARLTTLRDRLARLEAIGLVDYVIVQRFNRAFAALSPQAFIEKMLCQQLHTRYLLIGDDFRFGAKREGDFGLLAAQPSFETEAMPTLALEGERVSSSLVRQALQQGDLVLAKRLLGADYQISGRVIHGKKLGRTLGFPTANVNLLHRKPALQGVFVVEAETTFGCLRGVASLGLNPTVTSAISPRPDYHLEVHFFDFAEDLYGQRITVRFLSKLRDEEKYDSLEQLVAQITRDAAAARAFFH